MSNLAPTNSAKNSAQSDQTLPTSFYEELPEPFNVSFFVVSNDTRIDGRNCQHYISPLFATLEQAREFKAQATGQYPDCYLWGGTAYFLSEDDSNRLELLGLIVSTQETSGTKKPA